MLLTFKRTCSFKFQNLLGRSWPSTTDLPQSPCSLVRKPMPGVNHLPTATEAPGPERNFLNGLVDRLFPCSSSEYHAFQSPPTWINQLLQKELVATLYFCTGSESCAIDAVETPASANTINNFFITNFINKQKYLLSIILYLPKYNAKLVIIFFIFS